MEGIKPGSRARPKPKASRTIGQCARGATQNPQTLLFQIVGKSMVCSRIVLTGLLGVVQLRFHFFLRRACYGAILEGEDDACASFRWQFHDGHSRWKTTLDCPT